MISRTSPLAWVGGALILAARLGRYFFLFLWSLCQSKAVLATQILALQSQLAACKDRIDRKQRARPRFDPAFRLLWVLLSKLVDGWEDFALLMQPATVKRWV